MRSLFLTFSTLLLCLSSFAQSGTLDSKFGVTGISQTDAAEIQFGSAATGSALLPDGKILVGGTYNVAKVIRFLSNGNIDSTFAENGIASINTIRGTITCLAVQPDGKIVVAGNSAYSPNIQHVFAARFEQSGKLDETFGVQGVVKMDFKDDAGANAIALQSNKGIIIAGGGTTQPDATDFSYGTVTRLTEDGKLDVTFGSSGRIENVELNTNTAIAVLEDDKFLTGGYKIATNSSNWFVVSKYSTDGKIDGEFGIAGNATTSGFGYDGKLKSLNIQKDNRIVASGYSVGGSNEDYFMTAIRYQKNGSLDPSFGQEGKVSVPFPSRNSAAYDALLQPDGKIILSGAAYQDNALNGADFALCRLLVDGSIDSSFGIDGRQVTELGNTEDISRSALLQPDGKIVLVGTSDDIKNNKGYISLMRYNGDKEQRPIIVRLKKWLQNHDIEWQGLDNNSIGYYSIQYSKSGRDFKGIGKISGAGSNSNRQYDFKIRDEGFYRVVAIDTKGYKTFSNKIAVNATDITSAASIFPNPAKDYLTIQGLKTNATSNISISDGNGNVKMKGVSIGTEQYRSALNNMVPGTYFVNVTSDNKTEIITFVKQ